MFRIRNVFPQARDTLSLMQRRRAVFVALTGSAGTVLTLGACSLFTSLEGFSSTVVYVEAGSDGIAAGDGTASDRDGGDGSTTIDARVDAGGDAAVVGGVSIHPQGTFEAADNVCDPGWTAFQGSLAKSATAHSGMASCRVCGAPGITDYFTMDDEGAAGAAVVGARYQAEAWVRTDPGFAAPGPGRIFLRSFRFDGGFIDLESSSSLEAQPDSTWRLWTSEITITKPNGKINVFVGVGARPAACLLVDDVVLRRMN